MDIFKTRISKDMELITCQLTPSEIQFLIFRSILFILVCACTMISVSSISDIQIFYLYWGPFLFAGWESFFNLVNLSSGMSSGLPFFNLYLILISPLLYTPFTSLNATSCFYKVLFLQVQQQISQILNLKQNTFFSLPCISQFFV